MFTGIIESIGNLTETKREGTNLHLKISSPISNQLKIDQSVSHDGICLTVTQVEEDSHWVTAVDETLSKTSLRSWSIGHVVNLERCMQMNGRFDGHIVQGHVDLTAEVIDVDDQNGSWLFTFKLPPHQEVMVEKGSVTVNGVSLTCFDVTDELFKIAVIPYTYEHTNFHRIKKNSLVNIEFDLIGKYIRKLVSKTNSQ